VYKHDGHSKIQL